MEARLKQQLFKNINSTAKFCAITGRTTYLLQRMDDFSSEILDICEVKIRRKWKKVDFHSKMAITTQKRFNILNMQIKHQFSFPKKFN